MSVYPELSQAIDTVLGAAQESNQFKRRLRKLIELAATDESYRDEDVREVIDLIAAEESEA